MGGLWHFFTHIAGGAGGGGIIYYFCSTFRTSKFLSPRLGISLVNGHRLVIHAQSERTSI